MGQGWCQFTDEFKREAVALLASSGRSLSRSRRSWASRRRCFAIGAEGGMRAGAASNIPTSAPHFLPDPAAEISRLRRENDRLRLERDILKNHRGSAIRVWREKQVLDVMSPPPCQRW